jgi:RecA-family ATPase
MPRDVFKEDYSTAPDPSMPWMSRKSSKAKPLDITVVSSLAHKPVPERQWLVPEWIPARQVTLLSGDGGIGKSLLAMQLQIAAASAQQWLGLSTTPCRSLGFYAEDDADELHRRIVDLAEIMQVDIASLDRMAFRSTVEEDVELIQVGDNGDIHPTDYYFHIVEQSVKFGARLVILDASTNFYGGDEIRRRQVNSFVLLLRHLAIQISGSVLLLAHPSLTGMNSGSGLSGSTHWNNAVRSRLYFTRTKGDDADPDERELTKLKANYASTGDMLRLRWQRGGFVALDGPGGVDRAALASKADRVFRALLVATYSDGTWTSPNPASRNYAPSVFAKRHDREGLGKPVFDAAMRRLTKSGQIKIETYGRPSDPHSRLALA